MAIAFSINSRADALVNIYNSADVNSIMHLFCEDVNFSDYFFHAVNLNKAETQLFFAQLMSSNPAVFTTRDVTGTRDFVAHEMTIEFRAGDDMEGMGIKKGQFVRMAGVSLQSWRKKNIDTAGHEERIDDWIIFNQKEYFYVDEIKD